MDGNCLFRALSYFVTGTQDYHMTIREYICNFINNNPQRFCVSSDYILQTKMAQQHTWGTDFEILVAATLLNTRIFIYTPYLQVWKWHCHQPWNTEIDNAPSLYIYHRDINHYEPVIRI